MEVNAPGLKARPRSNGTTAYYWIAKAGKADITDYPTKLVRVHGSPDEMAARCRVLQSELKEWLSNRGVGNSPKYDGTLRSVIRLYQQTEESSYHTVKANTRVMYDESLKLLDTSVGARRLDKLTGLDFKRWYNGFKEPAEDSDRKARERAEQAARGITLPPNPERHRRAYKAMQLLRIVIKFGVVMNITECFRLATILENIEFSAPRPRTEAITFAHAEAICAKALEKGLLSIALAQAIQFELTLRQIDVIGLWVKTDQLDGGGITYRGQRWQDGLLWSHLDSNGILTKITSKTGKVAEHDTNAYPFLRQFIDMVPLAKRVGPIIKSEATGLPYKYRYFSSVWREIADEAGVPSHIWNRDSRAGGVTEGSDSGADIEHLRHHANHENSMTTQRYNRNTLAKTRSVAELRVAKRAENKAPQNKQ